MRLITDYASSLLVSDVNDSDTLLNLESSGGVNFPDPDGGPDYAILTIEDISRRTERVKLLDRDGDTLTVERGAEGTTPLAFSSGSRVELRSTASLMQMFFQRGVDDVMDANTEITALVKRYLVTGEEPLSGDLIEGELAVNIPDRKLWVGAAGASDGNPLPPVLISGAGGAGSVIEINQASHGFLVGQPVYFSGSVWTLAKADNKLTAGTHIVSEVRTADVFVAALSGEVTGVTGTDIGVSPLTPGAFLYVSTATAGVFVEDEPIDSGDVSNLMAVVLATTSIMVLPYRPLLLGSDVFGGRRQEWLTPTNGQTEFATAYDIGYLDVFVNGAKLASTDFTADDGLVFTLAEPDTDLDHVASISWGRAEMLPLNEFYTKAEQDAQNIQLVAEYDLTGLDLQNSPLIIPLESGYDYELKMQKYSHSNSDATIFMRLGTAAAILGNATYFQIYTAHIGTGNTYSGNYLTNQTQWIYCQDFLSDHVGATSEMTLFNRKAPTGKVAASNHWLGYGAPIGVYEGNGHLFYNDPANTEPITRLQIYTSVSGVAEDGLIQLYRLPKLGA